MFSKGFWAYSLRLKSMQEGVCLVLAAPTVVTHPTHPIVNPESPSGHQSPSHGKNDELSQEGWNAQGGFSADNQGLDVMGRGRGSHSQQDGATPIWAGTQRRS